MSKKKNSRKPKPAAKARNNKSGNHDKRARRHEAGESLVPISTLRKEFPIVAVGASAGGLEAFEQLLSAIPSGISMSFVLIPHLAPKHESIMTELLSKYSKLPIMQASD